MINVDNSKRKMTTVESEGKCRNLTEAEKLKLFNCHSRQVELYFLNNNLSYNEPNCRFLYESRSRSADFFSKELLEVNEAKSDGQKKAIKAIINEGNNVVVNIPTGMGKSLVIKVHAAIYRGWVLVVYPLHSLEADQQSSFISNGFDSRIFDPTDTKNNLQLYELLKKPITDQFWDKSRLLVIVPPDVLMKAGCMLYKVIMESSQLLGSLFSLNSVVFDEVHLFIEWMLFRPSFLNISKLHLTIQNQIIKADCRLKLNTGVYVKSLPRQVLMTACSNDEYREIYKRRFNMIEKYTTTIIETTPRQNFFLRFPMLSSSLANAEVKICKTLVSNRTPSLGPVVPIYVDSKRRAEKLAQSSNFVKNIINENWSDEQIKEHHALRKLKVTIKNAEQPDIAYAYHSGTTKENNQTVHEICSKAESRSGTMPTLIYATTAFGTGVNYRILLCLFLYLANINMFIQQVGRIARFPSKTGEIKKAVGVMISTPTSLVNALVKAWINKKTYSKLYYKNEVEKDLVKISGLQYNNIFDMIR